MVQRINRNSDLPIYIKMTDFFGKHIRAGITATLQVSVYTTKLSDAIVFNNTCDININSQDLQRLEDGQIFIKVSASFVATGDFIDDLYNVTKTIHTNLYLQ